MGNKPGITVSINPSYYCNLRCSFCYLTEAQLSDKQRVSIDTLRQRLDEVAEHRNIEHIDLYGGETFMLPPLYLDELTELLLSYTKNINIVTNGTVNHPMLNDPRFYVSVSFDYMVREKWEKTYNTMLGLERPFTILMLASPELMSHSVEEIIESINTLTHCENVEVKPYSSNQANSLPVKNSDYVSFVKRFIRSKTKKRFRFANEDQLKEVVKGNGHSYSDDHVYITPQGKFAVLEFDENGDEYFHQLTNFSDYDEWSVNERVRVSSNPSCSSCKYIGKCLSEHLKPIKPADDDCDGFITLIEWDERRTQVPAWKINQFVYNSTVEFSDKLDEMTWVETGDKVGGAISYLTTDNDILEYPGKSYAVALMYAKLLKQHFGEDFYDVLDDPELLYNNDPYFVTYSEDKSTYDSILKQIGGIDGISLKGKWRDFTVKYFESEMLGVGLY